MTLAQTAITIRAGEYNFAGDPFGGNILVAGGTVQTGLGGTATLYTGSIANSTGLTDLIGSGSGRFRYNSDDDVSNFTRALTPGVNAIYRDQPTLLMTAIDDTKTANGIPYAGGNGVLDSGFVNGDTLASFPGGLTYGGTSQGALVAGTYAITPGGYIDELGYMVTFVDGQLTINVVPVVPVDPAVQDIVEGTTVSMPSRPEAPHSPTLPGVVPLSWQLQNRSAVGLVDTSAVVSQFFAQQGVNGSHDSVGADQEIFFSSDMPSAGAGAGSGLLATIESDILIRDETGY